MNHRHYYCWYTIKYVTLNLTINNVTIPTVKNPQILRLTFDPALTFSEHARITKTKADSSIKILKALTSTSWGKQKETLLATYKTIILPVIELPGPFGTRSHLTQSPKTADHPKQCSKSRHRLHTRYQHTAPP